MAKYFVLFRLIIVSSLLAAAVTKHYKNRKHGGYLSGSRIVGGAYWNGYPYSVVSIEKWDNGAFRHSCTGNILTSRVVLTACHCVTTSQKPEADSPVIDVAALRLRVVAGASNKRSNSPFKQIVYAQAVEKHPRCSYPYIHDTAVIILNSDLVFTVAVTPARIFSNDGNVALAELERLVEAGVGCFAKGWGATSSDARNTSPSDLLKFSRPTLVHSNECSAKISFPCEKVEPKCTDVPDWHWVCVRDPKSENCYGDSGTGLTCNGFLWGVSSVQNFPCTIGEPYIFVDITSALYFVNKYPQNHQFPPNP